MTGKDKRVDSTHALTLRYVTFNRRHIQLSHPTNLISLISCRNLCIVLLDEGPVNHNATLKTYSR